MIAIKILMKDIIFLLQKGSNEVTDVERVPPVAGPLLTRRGMLIGAASLASSAIPGQTVRAAPASAPLFGAYTSYAERYADGSRSYIHTEAMLGQPLGILTAFGDYAAPQGWGDGTGNVNNTMESSARYDLSQIAGCGKKVAWAQPLAMGTSPYSVYGYGGDTAHPRSGLQDVASGAFDRTFAFVAAQLIVNGFPDAILRLGWEFNLPLFPWGNPWTDQRQHAAAYVAAFRHVAAVMRAVPGNSFKILWCPNKGKPSSPTTDVTLAYPGDDVVDYVGLDVYDDDLDFYNPQGYGTNVNKTRAQRWQESCLGGVADQRLAWLGAFSKTPTMRPTVAAAAAAGVKPIVIAEWGAGGPASVQDPQNDTYARSLAFQGGDDGYYVAQMLAWMRSNAVYAHGLYDIFDPTINYTGAISFDPGVTGFSPSGYTSNTVNTLSTGPKPFTVLAGLPIRVGCPLMIADPANPTGRFMEAIVTSYSGAQLWATSFAYRGTGYLNASVITTHPNALAPQSLLAVRSRQM